MKKRKTTKEVMKNRMKQSQNRNIP